MQRTKRFDPTLFLNRPYLNTYRERNVCVGDFFEEVSKNFFGLGRLATSSDQDACPDLCNPRRSVYMDSKAGREDVGIAIKKDQYQFYKDMTDLHFPSLDAKDPFFKMYLYYAFWIYNDVNIEFHEPEKVQEVLSKNIKALVVINIDKLSTLFGDSKATKCYRIRYKNIKEFTKRLPQIEVQSEAFGFKTNKFSWCAL